MKTTNRRTSIFARVRESWRNAALVSGMPYADYPFPKLDAAALTPTHAPPQRWPRDPSARGQLHFRDRRHGRLLLR